MKTKGKTPYEELGILKLSSRIKLMLADSNMVIKNLIFRGTGAHAITEVSKNVENILIKNNVIEDIGGSFLNQKERYGNGIQFYSTNVKNLTITKNIIRNVYDVGFTIQGSEGSGKDVSVSRNVFVQNSQDSEIWEDGSATGVYNYSFDNNVCVNQGRGWGYDARPDKYAAGHVLFWAYNKQPTKIYFHDNYVYNSRMLYYIEHSHATDEYFQKSDDISSNFNHYYMNNDTTCFRDQYKYKDKDNFISEYHKDNNSEFILLNETNETIINTAAKSYDYKEVRKFFVDEPDDDENDDNEYERNGSKFFIIFIVILIIIILLIGGFFLFRYITRKKNDSNREYLDNKKQNDVSLGEKLYSD